jgi:hypothetical protein
MRNIIVFYHCLLYSGIPPDINLNAFAIVDEQMQLLKESGLLSMASHFVVGLNGGKESLDVANLIIPPKAEIKLHGLQSKSENLTIVEIENWVKSNPGWAVLYFHCKGATQSPTDLLRIRWRRCMMQNLITNWSRCIKDLELYESVGCHWYKDMHGRSYWAGNFWWSRSEFLQTVPSISNKLTCRVKGVDSLYSRYESEVWLGEGQRLPTRKDYHPEGFMQCR